MRVEDILKLKGNKVFSITPEATLAEAIELMVTHDIGSLVVMQAGEMIGMITFREVLSALHAHGAKLDSAPVAQVMVRDPVYGKPDDTVDQMRAVMTEQHIRYLPIKQGGVLLGVLSFHDVARAALKAASLENRALKEYIKNWPEADAAATGS
jgi:CBS domain-containing protein